MPWIAFSICCGVRGGSTEMVGTSSPTAPKGRSCSVTSPACSFVRGTSTRQPNSGLVSNQSRFGRAFTAAPTTMLPGPASLAAFAALATSPSVDTRVRCSTVEPARTIAIGVSAG